MEEKANAPMLRIPASLMPSYNNVMATEEGKQAQKRVRVFCGVCEKLRYYSIHRGVTRIGGVIACEACRHFYQKFKRQPCILACTGGGSCLSLNDNSRIRCRACWVGHILSKCPVPENMYDNLVSHLPKEIQDKMPPEAQVAEKIPDDRKGSVGLEVMTDGEWRDVTIASQLSIEDSAAESIEAEGANCDEDSSLDNSGGLGNFSLRNFIKIDGGLEYEDEEPSFIGGLASHARKDAGDPASEASNSGKRKRSNKDTDDFMRKPSGSRLKDKNVEGFMPGTIIFTPSLPDFEKGQSIEEFCLFVSTKLNYIKDPHILQNVKQNIRRVIYDGVEQFDIKSKPSR